MLQCPVLLLDRIGLTRWINGLVRWMNGLMRITWRFGLYRTGWTPNPGRYRRTLLYSMFVLILLYILLNIYTYQPIRQGASRSQPSWQVAAPSQHSRHGAAPGQPRRHLVSVEQRERMYNRLKERDNESDIVYVRRLLIGRRDRETSLQYIEQHSQHIDVQTQHLQHTLQPDWYNYRLNKPGPEQSVWSATSMLPVQFYAAADEHVVTVPRYTLNHVSVCNLPELHLLVLVTSSITDQTSRMAVRQSWGRVRAVAQHRVRTLFLLGTGPAFYQAMVEAEDAQFHDIIQQDFQDGYTQRTFKIMMGLHWVREYCYNTHYVLLISDSVIPNFVNLVRYLGGERGEGHDRGGGAQLNKGQERVREWKRPQEGVAGREGVGDWEGGLYLGRVRVEESPHTRSTDRYVSNISWSRGHYPPYCERPFVLLSGDVADKMAAIIPHTPWLYPEDVYLGILAYKLGVSATHTTHFHHMTDTDNARQLLADPHSQLLLLHLTDDGHLPNNIIQLDSSLTSTHHKRARTIRVYRSQRPVRPVTQGDVFLNA